MLLLLLLLNPWPGWRGPDGRGVSTETNLPSEWGPDRNVIWKVPIDGQGHSSPVVWGNRVFLTSDVEGPLVPGARAPVHIENGQEFLHPDSKGADRSHRLEVLALDRVTGALVWKHVVHDDVVYDNRHDQGSYAAPTPVTDGERVFAYFESQGVHAFDFEGKLLWSNSLGPIGSMGMGPGTSPLLFENILILQCDEDMGEKSFIAALEKRTGEEIWRRTRPVQSSWATPVIVSGPKGPELVTSGFEWVIAYDPRSGEELWRVQGVQSNAIPSPVAGEGMVIVSTGYPDKRVFAIEIGRRGDLTGTDAILWQFEKGTAYVPSPILYRDYLYLMNDKGIVTCLEAKSGRLVYEGGRVPVPAFFMASFVAAEGKLFLTSQDGDTFVVRAGPEHEVLATSSVGEPVYASPAISQGSFFIRGTKHLFRIGS
ncbi:MAG: PQQ-binding-like beta-propeller repeat protein [Vicinamibacteria bacterium]